MTDTPLTDRTPTTETGADNSPLLGPGRPRIALRWFLAAICILTLVAVSTSWQSWERNTSLHSTASFPVYFTAILLGYWVWVGIGWLIYRWHIAIPMFSATHRWWWLIHLSLSVVVGVAHLGLDTLLLWLSLSQSFDYASGLLEKLIRWLPYELLAYWACLSAMTLITHRRRLLLGDESDYLSRLSVKVEDELKLIPVEKIDYIEACDNYVKVWSNHDRQMLKKTMNTLEKKLNPKQFMRVHRSYIVNLNAIDHINLQSDKSATIAMKCGQNLPLSRRRKAGLKRLLAQQ